MHKFKQTFKSYSNQNPDKKDSKKKDSVLKGLLHFSWLEFVMKVNLKIWKTSLFFENSFIVAHIFRYSEIFLQPATKTGYKREKVFCS